MRLRCATDGRDVVTTWQGTVSAHVTGEAPRELFRVAGMNIARCLQIEGTWHLTSRELMYYLDPKTGAALDRWQNPWTGATVPVVHVANAIIQHELSGRSPVTIAGDRAVADLKIPVRYPNPLAKTPELRRYSPAAMYEATEHFVLTTSADAVRDTSLPTVPWLEIRWHRRGPWLPWMDMGERAGELVYEATGTKVASIAELPTVLRDGIATRVPLFAHAPRCRVPSKNETSWTYFARHVAAYEQGATFPVAEPERANECAATAERTP